MQTGIAWPYPEQNKSHIKVKKDQNIYLAKHQDLLSSPLTEVLR